MSKTHDATPVTVTVARSVAPGRETDFEDWATRLTTAAAHYPGFLGAGLLRPGRAGQDWHVVYRFDRADHLAAWEQSPTRNALLADAEQLMQTTGEHRVSGLETWFALPGRTAPAPPRWKMFVVSLASIFALQLLVNLLLGGITRSWPLAARLVLFVSIVTASMAHQPAVAHQPAQRPFDDPAVAAQSGG